MPQSAPRSKRCEASVCMPWRLAMLRTVAGSNHADSISTFFVFSVIIESKPPITPASATGFSPSAMTRSSVESLRSTPSSVFSDFAIAGATNDDRPARQQVEIKGVRGMSEFVDRVVGGVGGVVDGARTQQFQALRDAFGRRTDLHPANDARRVPAHPSGSSMMIGKTPPVAIPSGGGRVSASRR